MVSVMTEHFAVAILNDGNVVEWRKDGSSKFVNLPSDLQSRLTYFVDLN